MLKSMKKKKKKVKTDDAEEGEGDAAGDGGDGGLDLSSMKKKKKSKKPKEGTEEDFAKRVAALELGENAAEGEDAEPTEAGTTEEGDMEKGTGIWQHDETKQIGYELLLSRFFTLLAQKNPDHASSGSRSYKIPPPQCLREGNKKTIFANIAEICKRMKRTDEHVTSYLFAELGTSGSVDGSRRLVIKGRFQQKQIENVLRRYISKSCHLILYWDPLEYILTYCQWNMSPAKPVDPLIPNSTKEKTDYTSSPATHADPDEVSLPSRLVSLPKLASVADNKVKGSQAIKTRGSWVTKFASRCTPSIASEEGLGFFALMGFFIIRIQAHRL
jgi:translation initiation factor 2 beta subunit (eIF-2beta)/eIF-5